MKRLFLVLILAGAGYYGYLTYVKKPSVPPNISTQSSSDLEIVQSPEKLNDLSSVLGASIARTFEAGKEILSNATGGKSDPIINQALTNIQEEVKDLPKETVEKIKYEFCKDIVTEYETKSSNN